MKKFQLDLSKYEVTAPMPVTKEDGRHVYEEVTQEYPLRENINIWLRSSGIFSSGEEIAEAIMLAKTIRDCKEDSIELDEREAQILKTAVNRHVALTAEGKSNLGGPAHEEAICRIIKMQEVQ